MAVENQEKKRLSPPKIRFTRAQRATYLAQANEIVAPFKLKAYFLPRAMAVGVVGDNRAFTPVIDLRGQLPDHETLAALSTEITNIIPVIKVTVSLAERRGKKVRLFL